jgi:phytoene desaturase
MVWAMDVKFKSRVIVIGGGLGGLAAAIRLAVAGCQVTVFERGERVGGKMGTLEWEGFQWDTGPSLLTMPHVLADLWAAAGAKLEEDLELLPLPQTCRYRWQDGTVVDEDEEFWQLPEVAAFLRHARGLYDISANTFLHHPLGEWKRQLTLRNLPLLRHLPKLADPRAMARTSAGFFPKSPHLQQLFNRFATYNGSSPYKAPSAFHIIPYVQARFGGWYAKGGMVAIARAMEKLALSKGVRVECGQEVARLQENAGRWTVFHRASEGGPVRPSHCEGVVCNMDTLAATKRFLDPGFTPKAELSMSGFVIHAAIGRGYPELAHHNILFSGDYEREFREIFHEASPASEPTIYISISGKSEAGRAPEGCENWFVLVNAPAAKPGFEWIHFAPKYADRILGMMTRFGLEDPRPHVRWMKTVTPEDFEMNHLAMGGALYGYASHSATSAFKRPAMAGAAPRLVFTGGSTHPGGGIPLVVLSGQMAARELLMQFGRPPIDLADALPS